MNATCPECGGELSLPEDAFVGEVVDCANCGAEIKVVGVDPLRVEPFEEEEK